MTSPWEGGLDYIAGMSFVGRCVVAVLALAMWGGLGVRGQDGAAGSGAEKAKDEAAAGVVPADMCRAGFTVEEIQKGKGRFPAYLEDNFAQLKVEVPALRGLRFEADPGAEPEKSEAILKKTGETIVAMLPRVPNLMAKEELSQASVALPYTMTVTTAQNSVSAGSRRNASQLYDSLSHGVEGEELDKVLDGMMGQSKHGVFGYRIQSTVDPTFGPMLREYRTDAKNEAVDVLNANAGSPRAVGFSSSWMMFKPANLEDARFRYLGHQKLGKHDTVVLAFAQIPGEVPVPAEITMGGGTCSYLQQGIVWIDEEAAQIVRMQTDLLQPLTDFHMTKLYSSMTFGEVRIAEKNLTLWMPNEVEIRWLSKELAGAERHKYSDYRLFGATSRIVLP
jgi:hypothetical protein